MSLALRPYQETGRDFLAARKRALLADEMRVGKTPTAILAADAVGAERVLVLCPAIAVPQWLREWARWSPGRHMGAQQLTGTGVLRAPIIVASYDMAIRRKDDLIAFGPDVFIVDEAHFARNPDAQRTRLVYGKDGLCAHSHYTWPLSGTPAPKHAAELWAMMRAFGKTGLTYAEFVHRYCWLKADLKIGGTKESMVPELRAVLDTFMLRRKRKDVAPDMPDIDFQLLELTSLHRPIGYNVPTMSDEELLAYLETNAQHDAELRIEVAKAKALALVEQIAFAVEAGLLQQTVVFGHHTEPLQALADGLNKRGIAAETITGETSQKRRNAIQEHFKAGKFRALTANILAAGTAIDLSTARHGYFLELDWVPANNAQAANRLVSMDKPDKVTIDVATWPGSIDERVQRVLMRRARELSQLY